MKNLVLALAILVALPFYAQSQSINNEASKVSFKIKNAGLTVDGRFDEISGQINFNAANPSASQFTAVIPTKSINTEVEMRDKHLREEDYFEVEKYPEMKFVSTSVSGANGKYEVTGKLTIKDVTKTITFPFESTQSAGKTVLKGSFVIDRRDYHVGGNSWIMGDDVTVMLEVVAG